MPVDEIKEIPPPAAWAILRSDKSSVLLDVRSRFEYEYVGHPESAINVPLQEVPDWRTDPDFASKVAHALNALPGRTGRAEHMTVLTLCRSGKRSMAAAKQLAESGFTSVINIAEGFEGDLDNNRQRGNLNGWRYHRLPWRQG